MASKGKQWIAGIMIAAVTAGAGAFPGQGERVSAETVYTYRDAASPLAIDGTGIKVSGPHVVWRTGSGNYTGQIRYGNRDTGQTINITNHGKPTDSPAIGVDGSGSPVVVWTDKRSHNAGNGNLNWDIYAYDVKTGKEVKLNAQDGQHRTPFTDGRYVVWQTNPSYDMQLYDLAEGKLTELGKGRDPMIGGGRIVYKGASDGDLYEYGLATGATRKILDLPYSSYVERFVFNGEEVLWKERDLDGYGKYTYLDLGGSDPKPVDLTQPVMQGEREYKEMSIAEGAAVWLESSGDKAIMRGADLVTPGQTYTLGVTDSSQFAGFDGGKLVLVSGGRLVSREIVRSEAAPPSSAVTPPTETNGTLIGPEGGVVVGDKLAKLIFEPGTFGKNARVGLERVGTVASYKTGWTWLNMAWKWETDAPLGKPAELTVELEQPIASSAQLNRTGLYRYEETTGQWTYAGGTFDTTRTTIRAKVEEPGVYALFRYEPVFSDMKRHWAANEIEVLASRWIVSGMPDGRFEPARPVTRAQFVKMLVEASGKTVMPVNAASFKDVARGHWAYEAIGQATAAGWVKGSGADLFKPNAPVTREEMMVMLANAASLSKPEDGEALAAYADANRVHAWAAPSVRAVLASGLIKGTGDRLNPGAGSTRAEAAVVIYRWLAMKGEVFSESSDR